MRTSDPAVALRFDESSALAAAPIPDVDPSAISNMATELPCGTVPEPRRRWLTLVTSDAEPVAGALETGDEARADASAPPEPRLLPLTTHAALPTMASPVDMVMPALFGTSEGVVELLETANEQRRVLDLLWSAYEVGAMQLPNALVARLQRARDRWPAALGAIPVPQPS